MQHLKVWAFSRHQAIGSAAQARDTQVVFDVLLFTTQRLLSLLECAIRRNQGYMWIVYYCRLSHHKITWPVVEIFWKTIMGYIINNLDSMIR